MDAFDLYAYRDYKKVIKDRLAHLKKTRKGLTLKFLARKIPLQYTYLSAVLNKPKQHLNEAQLYRACAVLDFYSDEIEFLMLLRSYAMADDLKYRDHVHARLERIASERSVRADHAYVQRQGNSLQSAADVDYLLNPLNLIVGCALDIPHFQKEPTRLCAELGVTRKQLKSALDVLERMGVIDMGESGLVFKGRDPIHIGKDHPLMRTHQIVLKNGLIHRMANSNEDDKESFFVTFTMDQPGFLRTKALFKEFLKNVQGIASSSQNEHLFQMNFDLLRWF